MAVGTAFINLIPEIRGFHRQARRDLNREELTAQVKLIPEFDRRSARRQVEESKKSIGTVSITMTPDIDAGAARTQASSVADRIRQSVPFDVSLHSAEARGQAPAAAARMRQNVPFRVDLDTGGAGVQATAAAASMRRTVTFNVDIDRNQLGSAVAAVGAGGANMAASGLSVGSSFARAGILVALLGPLIVGAVGLAAAAIMALPALLGAVAVPIAAIVLGMEGIKAAAATVAPAFAPIKQAVSDTFKAVLIPVFQQLTALVPILQAGLVGTAQALGVMASAITNVLTSSAGMAWLSQIFAGVNAMISGMAPAMATLTAAFMQLAAVGIGPLASGLIAAVGNFATLFQQMIQQTAATGLLQSSITMFTQILGLLLGIMPPLLAAGMQMLMIFGPAMMDAFTALGPALGPIMQVFGVLTAVFFQLLAALLPVISALFTALMPVLMALMPVISFVANVLGVVLVAALQFITPMLQVLAPVIAGLLVLWGAWVTWTWILAAAQWALNAAFLANPITWVIIGIVALVAAVIWAWQNFGWFRDIVTGAWIAITTAAGWAWSILGMVFNGIWIGIQSVGSFFVWLWQAAIVPAWNGIAMAAMWAWSILGMVFGWIVTGIQWLTAIVFTVLVAPWLIAWNLLSSAAMWAWNAVIAPVFNWIAGIIGWLYNSVVLPIFGAIAAAWGWMAGAVMAIWNGVLRPAWQAVADFAGWLWNTVLSAVFNAIAAGWNGLLSFIRFMWESVLRPTWDALQAAARWMWENTLLPVFNAIGAGWNGLMNFFRFLWETVLRPTWDALQAGARFMWEGVLLPVFNAIGAGWRGLLDGIRWMWENVLRPAFDAIKGAVHAVGEAFASAVRWIGDVWSTIKGLLARPINFMINVVYMRGVKAAWDTVAGWLKLPPLPGLAPIPEFARGGKVPGAGNRDTVPAWLTPGEYVISKPVVDYWGLNNIDRAHTASKNRRSGKRGRQEGLMAQGYAAGGEVALDRAFKFAQSMSGKAYVFGGGSEAGTDCSGYMAMIKRALLDERPYARREWATETGMPPPGFVHGLGAGFSIGVKHGGAGGGHTAGTLGGMLNFPATNVEAGGSHNTSRLGGPAAGADHPQFGNEHYKIPFLDGAFVSGGGGGGGGGSVPNPVAVMLHGLKHGITDPIRGGIGGGIDALLGGAGEPGTWKSGAKGATFKIFDSIVEWVDKKVDELFPALAGFGGGGGGVASANPNVVEAVRETARSFGWDQGPQWDAIAWIIGKESGWNPAAANPTSAARGLFQKMTSVHGPVEPTPGGQALWGLNYIRGRYRDPLGAKAFWESHGHYDSGGWLPPGRNLTYNGTGKPEAVLTADQWDSLSQAAQGNGASITVNYAESDVDPQRVASAIDRRLAMTGRV